MWMTWEVLYHIAVVGVVLLALAELTHGWLPYFRERGQRAVGMMLISALGILFVLFSWGFADALFAVLGGGR